MSSSIDMWYATRATGIAALVLLTATMILGILTAGRAKSAGPAFARADIHRRLSVLSVVFVALHVLTSVLDTYVHISWLTIVVPFTSGYHTFWLALGTIGVDMFLAVAISSALRQRIPARIWRILHWLAYLSWPAAVSHALGMGTDAKLSWVLGLLALCIASIAGAIAWRVAGALRAKDALPKTIISPRRSIGARAVAARADKGAVS
jgi:methionine sulfoxide reductase heme-binding subunit